MSLQNHNAVWLNQKLKDLKTENPHRMGEIIAFEKYAETLIELYANRGIDMWISDISLKEGEIAYTIGAQAHTENPQTRELLERLANA